MEQDTLEYIDDSAYAQKEQVRDNTLASATLIVTGLEQILVANELLSERP